MDNKKTYHFSITMIPPKGDVCCISETVEIQLDKSFDELSQINEYFNKWKEQFFEVSIDECEVFYEAKWIDQIDRLKPIATEASELLKGCMRTFLKTLLVIYTPLILSCIMLLELIEKDGYFLYSYSEIYNGVNNLVGVVAIYFGFFIIVFNILHLLLKGVSNNISEMIFILISTVWMYFYTIRPGITDLNSIYAMAFFVIKNTLVLYVIWKFIITL